jgi:hypothetical protein
MHICALHFSAAATFAPRCTFRPLTRISEFKSPSHAMPRSKYNEVLNPKIDETRSAEKRADADLRPSPQPQ